MNRRRILKAVAAAPLLLPFGAQAQTRQGGLRSSIDIASPGIRPVSSDRRSAAFQDMIDRAAAEGKPVALPAGGYVISNIVLPDGLVLTGVPGRTRLHYGGGGHFLAAQNARRITLAGLVLDAGNAWLADHVSGALDLRGVETAVVEDCILLGSAKSGLHLEGSGGRIEACDISGAADFGLYAVEGRGLRIAANTVSACANGGVAVHRWQVAEDGSTIADNRVFDIGAANGGTGQWGNGINVFRANGVSISGNRVSDCAFSAIRANACSDLRVSGNSARKSGETAIYAEFGFEGAAIAGNTVDGAANGISVVNFNDGGRLATVSANIVRNLRSVGPYPADPPGFGVGISVEADTAVTGNVVENAPLYGVNLGWGEFLRDCVASGNVIREARYGVAVTVADGAGSAVIADNRIAARDAAIVGHRWAKIVTGDLAAGGKVPANVTVERNGVG